MAKGVLRTDVVRALELMMEGAIIKKGLEIKIQKDGITKLTLITRSFNTLVNREYVKTTSPDTFILTDEGKRAYEAEMSEDRRLQVQMKINKDNLCKNGLHKMVEENIVYYGGKPRCRQCHLETSRRYNNRKQARQAQQ